MITYNTWMTGGSLSKFRQPLVSQNSERFSESKPSARSPKAYQVVDALLILSSSHNHVASECTFQSHRINAGSTNRRRSAYFSDTAPLPVRDVFHTAATSKIRNPPDIRARRFVSRWTKQNTYDTRKERHLQPER